MALQLTLQLKATGGQNQCNWLRGHSNSREAKRSAGSYCLVWTAPIETATRENGTTCKETPTGS